MAKIKDLLAHNPNHWRIRGIGDNKCGVFSALYQGTPNLANEKPQFTGTLKQCQKWITEGPEAFKNQKETETTSNEEGQSEKP